MSQKQAMQRRPLTANGSSYRRTDKDLGSRSDKLLQSAKSGSGISGNAGVSHGVCNHVNSENIMPTDTNGLLLERPVNGSRGGGLERMLHNRLLFITMFLIGQPVDVQVKNGSVYSGIFHTANVGRDYGIVLKMARLTKDGSVKGRTNEGNKDVARKAPMKTLIIFANDLVQVIAKDISLSGDGMGNGRAHENRHDIVTDSFLSQGHHIEVERELKPWTPDKDAPESHHLENTFQNTWNRNWDQFETNKSLFGVESTFDEELYTTKLERGPQMRDLEEKASIIAREIEEQATGNFHLAEERGIHLSKEFESLDEESRFSSVLRGEDIREDNEDRYLDSHNEETFGIAFTEDGPSISNDFKASASIADESDNKPGQTFQASSTGSVGAGGSPYQSLVSRGSSLVLSSASDPPTIQSFGVDSSFSQVNNICRGFNEINLHENANSSMQKPDDQADHLRSFADSILDKIKGLEFCSSDVSSSSSGRKMSSVDAESDSVQKREWSVVARSGANTMPVPKTDGCPLPSAPHIPTGSSSRSASLKKSTLNPNAKEFKFNPNAKSYNPCFATPRPASSVVQAPVYMAGNISPLTPMQAVPVGLGVSSLMQQPSQPAKVGQFNNPIAAAGVSAAPYLQPVATFVPRVSGTTALSTLPVQPAIKIPSPGQQIIGHSAGGQQPIRYMSQAAPLHQPPAYLHPNTQTCSQQMVFGQPGQVVYIQSYPHEMMQGLPFNLPQGSIPTQAASQQAQQPKHRGTAVHGMQFCVAAPFISGQQPYIHSGPISQLPNNLQPSPGVLVPTSLSGIQIPQGMVAGIGPAVQNGTGLAVGNGMWVGGKGATTNFQQ